MTETEVTTGTLEPSPGYPDLVVESPGHTGLSLAWALRDLIHKPVRMVQGTTKTGRVYLVITGPEA